MTMPTKSQTIVDDPIVNLQRRVIQAAREKAQFLGLGSEDAAAELKNAQQAAKVLGEELAREHATRTGRQP
jgi:hypothetical protein